MASKPSKTTRQSRLSKILAGLAKYFSGVTITLGGVAYAYDDLRRLIQGDLDAMTASAQAKAAYSAQVQVERNVHAKVNPVLRLLRNFVIAQFGDTQDASGKLADFGYAPRKSTKKTLEVKVGAQEKTKATRAARHTLGSKQKTKVKGTVPAPAPAAAAPIAKT